MKVFYSALLLILLHGMAHAQCEDFSLTVSDVQPPACPNAADGAITLNAAGAQGVVSYAWSEAGLSGSSVSGLAPGTYSVTATDDGGCEAVETVVLEAALVADAGPDIVAYCGADVVSLGGVAGTEVYFSSDITPIEFSDSNQELVPFRGISGEVGFAPAPDSFDPASSDSLYVEIGSAMASAGNVVCLPVRVYNFMDIVGAAFTINYDFTHLNFIEVTGLNPNLPGFSEAGNMATPNTGLDAGFIILNYFELSLSGVNLSDGSTLFTLCFEVVDISGTSAGPDITYQWAGPNNFTSMEPFPQVTQSGAYTLRITDTSQPDCWAEDEVEVTFQPDSIGVVLADTLTPCLSQPVVLEPEISGGQPPFSYLWSTSDTTASLTVTSTDAPADYSVTITSADGCSGLASARVSVENMNAAMVNLGPDRSICPGEALVLDAGSGAAAYSWNTGQATQSIIVQPSQTSTYSVTVTDVFGCITTDEIVVAATTGIEIVLSPPLCNDNGTPDPDDDTFTFLALINASLGGSWVSNLGPAGSYGTTATFGPFPIAAGDVTLTVADAGAPSCNTTTVISPPAPCSPGPLCGIQAIVQEITCDNNNTPADTTDDTFTLDILVTGGPSGGWVEDSSGLSGDYGVPFTFGPYPADYGHVGLIFHDFLDISCNTDFDLYTPVACSIDCQQDPVILTLSVFDVTCNGGADGEIEVMASGGGGGYTYDWNIGVTGTVLPGLTAGGYSVTATDIFGCEATLEAFVSEPPMLSLSLNALPVSCAGADDGSIEIFVTGGVPPYTYFSTGPGGLTSTENTLAGLSEGVYTIIVTDANGCSVAENILIWEEDSIVLDVEAIQQPACSDSNDGILNASASGGQGPYEYLWSTGFTGQTHSDLSPGIYFLTVVDGNGCTATTEALLEALLTADAGPAEVLNCNNPTVTLDGSLSTTGPNIAYEWTGLGGSLGNQLNITVSDPGAYILEVTDTSQPGCSAADTVLVVEDVEAPVINIAPNYVSCDSAILYFPPSPILMAEWGLPGGGTSPEPLLEITESGTYVLMVTNIENGCSSAASIPVLLDPSQCATLKGRLVRDTLADCVPTADEPGLANWLMVIQGGGQVYYAVTQAGGHYEQSVSTGDYEVYPLLPGPLWLPCQDSYTISLQQPGEMAMLDIPVQKAEACPVLSVDVSLPILRRCWSRSIPINYCNEGTGAAEGAYIVVTLDDAFTYQSATAPLLSQDGNQFTFDIGDVAIGGCGTLYVTVQVSCDAVVGQTLCAEAKIFPNAPCSSPSPNWSGASLQVKGACEGAEAVFRVENAGAGDMPAPLPCIVIEDGVMLLANPDSIRLNSGEAFTYRFPANGATYRLEMEQEPFHPGHSMPVAVLEGCGANDQGGFSTGFVNQLALDDANPFIDIECREVVGSYDPNDKHGFPRGYGGENFIYPGTDIEYLVQFQNTGNDTAFLVVIRDTLSEHLDITSIQPGAASHPYTWDIDSNNILVFTFDNILLPDSTTNLEGSQGFVEFKVAQQDSLPLGTVIENTAAIYFDVNEPIITNTTIHTLGYDFIEVISFIPEVKAPELKVSIIPNPMSAWALLQLEGWPGGEGRFELFDLQGRRLREQRFSGATFRFERRGLPAGVYAFRIVDERGRWGSGRLVIR